MAMQVVTPETMDDRHAVTRFAIESSGRFSSSWRTLDARMTEQEALAAFELATKPSDIDVAGPWTHKLVRLIVNRYGEELDRAELDRKIEA